MDDKTRLKGSEEIHREVRRHYGLIAVSPANGCCGGSSCSCENTGGGTDRNGYSDSDLKSDVAGANLGLGCGNPVGIASLRAGETVLDLGSGAGFDCMLAAKRVGDEGKVIGVDMTPEMVARARESAARQRTTNVEFALDEIEHLPVADGSVDVVISNCVVNLSPRKDLVFQEVYRVLKPGGRIAIADIVAVERIPEEIRNDVASYVECLAGAVDESTLRAFLESAGFVEIRVDFHRPDGAIADEAGGTNSAGERVYARSALVRAVKPWKQTAEK